MPSVRALVAVLLLAAASTEASFGPGARVDPRLADDLVATDAAERAVVVHVREGADRAAVLDAAGVERALLFEHLDRLAWAAAPPSALRELARSPHVAYLEDDAVQDWHLDSARLATRIDEVVAPASDVAGFDGSGIGVAVIDSGLDATHPDLRQGENVALNLKFVGESIVIVGGAPVGLWQEVPDSDTSSGHGTHVAGIVAGLGTASDGRLRGAAPGASIYGLGAGEALSVLHALAALDWVLENHATVTPPIRVVSNSWGGAGEHDPDAAIAQAVDALVEAGLVVVFSAGNDAGDGTTVRTNVWANNPKPGVVNVGNYDDGDAGARDGDVSGSSSRGDRDKPETWPDVSAPGTLVTSAFAKGANLLVPVGFVNGEPTDAATLSQGYVVASGTSMAAPHVSGLVAILLEARPDLTPGEVEAVLEATATPFGSGGIPAEGHFARGRGLVDAVAAVEMVLAPELPAEVVEAAEDDDAPAGDGAAAPRDGPRGNATGSGNDTLTPASGVAPGATPGDAETPAAPLLLALAAIALAARRR